MKQLLSLLLCVLLLAGCDSDPVTEISPATTAPEAETLPPAAPEPNFQNHVSRFDSETIISLSDEGITINGGEETDAVFISHDIIYYEDRDSYSSGNPYGEGEDWERHTAEEAAAHTVVNITAPGAYRLSGSLSAGQIRIDLGSTAYENPDAVVELILDGVDISCTVAPAILFLNTYECDGMWSVSAATAQVDTSAAGANLILEGNNTVSGSHVAKIYKDSEGEKKLWKQDGAIYSYMSMNVWGSGSLALTADNEGLDTELHLTVNGGDITIRSGNDGINTNEDGVSVTTINGGILTILAGLGAEGDGIDSNGFLVINGGIVTAFANPGADAGMDADLGSYIHGGTVIALGSTMDWAESDSKQVTMNLQFASQQRAGSEIKITTQDGMEVFSFTPEGEHLRPFSGMILSSPALTQGETYHIFIDDTQMVYAGTDVMQGPGGFGGHPGGMPGNFDPENIPEGFEPGQMPEGFDTENPPEGFDPFRMGSPGQRPEGMTPPEGFDGEMPAIPEGMERPGLSEGETFPQGELPEMPQGGFGSRGNSSSGKSSTDFYMNDMVNFFSGVSSVA